MFTWNFWNVLFLIETHILTKSLFFLFEIESWLKKRWRSIRNDYRRITIYNHTHTKKVPIHNMAKHLNFLTIDLNGANNMDFDDLKWPKSESFHITKEMLDDCDINESVTIESISVPKVCSSDSVTKSNAQPQSPVKIVKTYTKPIKQNEPEHQLSATKHVIESNDNLESSTKTENPESLATNSTAEQRCKDEIFGEFVVATLKKLPLEENKRVKKQIMDILLEI